VNAFLEGLKVTPAVKLYLIKGNDVFNYKHAKLRVYESTNPLKCKGGREVESHWQWMNVSEQRVISSFHRGVNEIFALLGYCEA
jgi:hypothetical protein